MLWQRRQKNRRKGVQTRENKDMIKKDKLYYYRFVFFLTIHCNTYQKNDKGEVQM